MKISKLILTSCLFLSLTSCDEIAHKLGYARTSSNSVSESSAETEAKKKQKIKENIADYVKIVWNNGSYYIQNDTDYTLEKVSVMTTWTQSDYPTYEKMGFQEPRHFTYIPAHSRSTSIEYNQYRMHDMKGQIFEIKCSALGL